MSLKFMPKNQGIVPIVVAIIIAIILGGGGYVAYKFANTWKVPTENKIQLPSSINQKEDATSTNQEAKKSISDCDSKNNTDEKNRCYEEIAIKSADINVCSKITTSSTFDHCVVGVAGMTKNIALCAKVKSDNTRNICYGSVAYHTLDLSICDRIVEPHSYPYADVKDLCYANVAGELKDVSICEKIKIPTEQDKELGPLPTNFQGGRVYCYQQVAKSLNDRAICEKIISPNERSKCTNSIQSTGSTGGTTNWKIYRNDKYGFEFQYPPDITFQPLSDNFAPYFDGITADLPSSYNLPNSFQRSQKIIAGVINTTNKEECMSKLSASDALRKSAPVTINAGGITFNKSIVRGDCAMDGCGTGNNYAIWQNDKCYWIGYSAIQFSFSKAYNCGATDCQKIPAYTESFQAATETSKNLTELIEKILSTFKFI